MDKSLIPKLVSILYIVFISLFALDTPILSLGFLIHIIPSLILVIILIFSWKNGKIGATAFLICGIMFTFFFNTYRELISFPVVTLPLLVISGLFWIFRKK